MNHRAPRLPESGLWVTQQGRPAWPARSCSSEPETVVIDRLPEDFDERQDDSADGEVALYMLKVVAAICATCFLIWARARGYV